MDDHPTVDGMITNSKFLLGRLRHPYTMRNPGKIEYIKPRILATSFAYNRDL